MEMIFIDDASDLEIKNLLFGKANESKRFRAYTCDSKPVKKFSDMDKIDRENAYYEELELKAKSDSQRAWTFGGGYYAAKGDYEGACLARAEWETGLIS